jgi:hypothetical protein
VRVRSYDDLCLALRARAEHLNVSRETIDEVAGFQASYSAKLLATPPHRKFGSMSFNAMIQALGVKLVVLEDGEAMDRLRHRLTPRQAQQVRWKPAASTSARTEIEPGVKALFMRTIAALGGKALQCGSLALMGVGC